MDVKKINRPFKVGDLVYIPAGSHLTLIGERAVILYVLSNAIIIKVEGTNMKHKISMELAKLMCQIQCENGGWKHAV